MISRRTVVGGGLALAATPAIGVVPRRYPRQVLAFYYPWYGNPKTSGRWFHWQGPNNEAPRQSPTLNHPTLGFYDSHDPAVIARHVAQAKAAGITALIVSWWGIGSFEDKALATILDAARGAGLHAKGRRGGSGARCRLSDEDLWVASRLVAGARPTGAVPVSSGASRPARARLAQGGGSRVPDR
jgi:hypothetical protein